MLADTQFVWPYNLGRLANLRQVITWSCRTQGDGITWQVVEGTDQFTLTREQLEQAGTVSCTEGTARQCFN